MLHKSIRYGLLVVVFVGLFISANIAHAESPVITSVSPTAVSVGDTISVRGTNIPANTWMRFGFIDNRYYAGQLVKPTFVSTNEVTFTIPVDFGKKERLGLSTVVLTDSDGTALSNELHDIVRVGYPPTILNLQDQDSGVAPGDQLSLGGYNFGFWSFDEQKCLSSHEYVVFDGNVNNLITPYVVLGCGIIRLNVPATMSFGKHTIQVARKTDSGLLLSNALDMMVVSSPVVTSVRSNTPSIGDVVEVTGTNFASNATIVLDNGDTHVTPTFISKSELRFTVPSHTGQGVAYSFDVGVHKLQVSNNGSMSNSISFTVVPVLQNTHLTITEPSGYRTWKIGGTQVFRWKTERVPATATGSITFASAGYDGVVVNKKIADNIPNTGSFTWTSVGKAADGSAIPTSKYPYGFQIVMNVPGLGVVSDYKDRTITLSDTEGATTPSPAPTSPVVESLSNTGADNRTDATSFIPTPTNPLLPTTPTTSASSAIATQIALLRAQIAAMQGTPTPSTGTTPSSASTCTTLTKNLSYKSTDAKTEGQVTLFQQFLQNDGYLTTSTYGYFGPATLKATKAFQRTEGINPTGYVGPLTRAKIQALSCE